MAPLNYERIVERDDAEREGSGDRQLSAPTRLSGAGFTGHVRARPPLPEISAGAVRYQRPNPTRTTSDLHDKCRRLGR